MVEMLCYIDVLTRFVSSFFATHTQTYVCDGGSYECVQRQCHIVISNVVYLLQSVEAGGSGMVLYV